MIILRATPGEPRHCLLFCSPNNHDRYISEFFEAVARCLLLSHFRDVYEQRIADRSAVAAGSVTGLHVAEEDVLGGTADFDPRAPPDSPAGWFCEITDRHFSRAGCVDLLEELIKKV